MQCCSISPFALARGASGALFLYWWTSWSTLAVEAEVDPNWDSIFRTRNDDDWRAVWHTERHRRCYHDLYEHMNWVCQKDIYAVRKRRKRSPSFPFIEHPFSPQMLHKRKPQHQPKRSDKEERDEDTDYADYPFIAVDSANSFLGQGAVQRRSQDLHKRGIIDECCHATSGCSWEEYAEYCPANSRIRNS